MQEWFIRTKHGDLAGPFTPVQLKHLADTGQLRPDSDIRLGDSKWAKAHAVKGLFGSSAVPKVTEPQRGDTNVSGSARQAVAASAVSPLPRAPVEPIPTVQNEPQTLEAQEPRKRRKLFSRKGVLVILGLLLLIWSFFEFDNARAVDNRWKNYQFDKQYNESEMRKLVDGDDYRYRTPDQRMARMNELAREALKIEKETAEWISNPPPRMSDTGMYILVGAGLLCFILAVAIP